MPISICAARRRSKRLWRKLRQTRKRLSFEPEAHAEPPAELLPRDDGITFIE